MDTLGVGASESKIAWDKFRCKRGGHVNCSWVTGNMRSQSGRTLRFRWMEKWFDCGYHLRRSCAHTHTRTHLDQMNACTRAPLVK